MELRDSRVYYGTCSTAANESEKVVEVLNPVFIDGQNNILDLVIGDVLVVKFDNGNTNSNPVIRLKVKDLNNNISVSADTGLTALIKERYDWAEQEIMSFVYTYTGSNNGEAVSENGVEVTPIDNESDETEISEIVVVIDYAWKPIELPIASDDTYGVTKLITDIQNLIGNEDQPVSYNIIQNFIENSLDSLGLTYNNNNGNLTLDDNGNKTINIPVPPTKTSQLINDGEPREQGEENTDDRYWSSRTNNYVMTKNLGIGYAYTPNEPNASQQVMKSFVPYSTFRPSGYKASGDTVNVIRIGRDALQAYQNGQTDIEPDPYLRLYGNKIDLLMGADGIVGIGDCDISNGNTSYERDYMFEPDKATFNQNLIIKSTNGNNRKLVSKYIEYNGTELEDRLTNFYIKSYVTDVLSYPSADDGGWKSVATNCEKYRPTECTKSKSGASLWFEITNLPTGYVPIGIVGYNLDEANVDSITSTPSRMIMWECWLVNKSNKYYFQCALTNSDHKKNSIKINYKVLFVKERLVN